MRHWFVVGVLVLGLAAGPLAQAIPPPTQPVLFCGTQAPPTATSYQLVFDGGAPEPLTMAATMDTSCPAGSTHSFTVPAARFTVGQHTVLVRSTNNFGTTAGPAYTVTVGVAPGAFTVTGIKTPGAR